MRLKARFWAYMLVCAAIGLSPTACRDTMTQSQTQTQSQQQVSIVMDISSITLSMPPCVPSTGQAVAHTQPSNLLFAWESSNPQVATVDALSGVITAVSPGTAKIFATTVLNGVKIRSVAEITVTVNPCQITTPTPPTIVLNPPTLSLFIGATTCGLSTFQVKATTVPSGLPVSFRSDNASVATVDQSGNVTASSVGTANIIGTTSANSLSASDTVSVAVANCAQQPPPPKLSVVVTPALDTLRFGGQNSSGSNCSNNQMLTATVFLGSVAITSPVTWSSDNASAVTVGPIGSQTANAVGTSSGTAHATATATVNGQTASGSNTNVSVPCNSSTPPQQVITILDFTACFNNGVAPAPLQMPIGGVLPGQQELFGSSNRSVITVDLAGKMTFVAMGTTVLSDSIKDTNVKTSRQVTIGACPPPSNDLVSLAITPTSKTLCPGEIWQPGVSGHLGDGTFVQQLSVVWSMNQTGFISQNGSSGQIGWTAAGGNVTIKATSSTNSSVSATASVATIATCPISSPVISVGITPAGGTVQVGSTQPFQAAVNTQPGVTDKTVTWSVSDGVIGSINASTGLFTALKVGTVTVIATANADHVTADSVNVTVTAAPNPTITITGPNGETGGLVFTLAGIQLKVTVTNPPATGQIFCSSSDAAHVAVNPQTCFAQLANSGVAPGQPVTITAQWSTDPTIFGKVNGNTGQ